MITVTCQGCGKKIKAQRKSKKFCSPACRQSAYRNAPNDSPQKVKRSSESKKTKKGLRKTAGQKDGSRYANGKRVKGEAVVTTLDAPSHWTNPDEWLAQLSPLRRRQVLRNIAEGLQGI